MTRVGFHKLLRPIIAPAALDLDKFERRLCELTDEVVNGLPLRFESEAALNLFRCPDSNVTNEVRIHSILCGTNIYTRYTF